MIVVKEKSMCTGCYACFSACPKQCISMIEDEEGFCYPLADASNCINCGLCEKICPINKQEIESQHKRDIDFLKSQESLIPEAYAVMNKNEEIRLKSSSGGMFTLLAEEILLDGGYVFGAVMSEDCKSVYHIGTNKIEELEKLRGSKYLQSIIGNTYQQVKELLKQDKRVLFSGTPCQIEGLKSYLDREYENLLCVDFICHGCPSSKVWKKYVDFRMKKTKVLSVRKTLFRHKLYGWKAYSLLFEYPNNKEYVGKQNEDLYMKAFLNDSVLRPSCYACRFKKLNRSSDITLADFWGIEEVLPEMDDDKGTSLVIVHSVKGKELFKKLDSKMKYQKVDILKAIKYNPSMIHSAKANKGREDFFENLEELEFDELVKKFAKSRNNWKKKIIISLKKIGIYDMAKVFYKRIKNI